MLPGSASGAPRPRTGSADYRLKLLLSTDNSNLFHLSAGRLTGGIAANTGGRIFFGNGANIGSVSLDGSVEAQQWLHERAGSIDGPAEVASFTDVGIMCSDGQDSLYVADAGLIRKVTPDMTATTIADLHQDRGYDQRPLVEVTGLATDRSGNVHFCAVVFAYDGRNDKYHVFERSIVTTDSDGVVANVIDLPRIDTPVAIRIDAEQNLYLLSSTRILRISPDEQVTVFADLGAHGMPGDIIIDADGTLYVSDAENHAVQRVGRSDGIETVANLDMPGRMALIGPGRLAVIARGGIYTIDVA